MIKVIMSLINVRINIKINGKTNRKIKREEKGSITVEAAFVMPVVVFCITALIYLAFYLHDYCRLAGTLDLVMHKACIAVKHEADISTGRVFYESFNNAGVFDDFEVGAKTKENRIEKYLAKELANGLFVGRIEKSDVEVTGQTIKITVCAKADIRLPMFGRAIDKITDIELQRSCPVHNPAKTIRICELILDTGSKIKGINKIKDIVDVFAKK